MTLSGRAAENLEAGAVIAMIPCLVLYIALQRYYIRGLTSRVVKG